VRPAIAQMFSRDVALMGLRADDGGQYREQRQRKNVPSNAPGSAAAVSEQQGCEERCRRTPKREPSSRAKANPQKRTRGPSRSFRRRRASGQRLRRHVLATAISEPCAPRDTGRSHGTGVGGTCAAVSSSRPPVGELAGHAANAPPFTEVSGPNQRRSRKSVCGYFREGGTALRRQSAREVPTLPSQIVLLPSQIVY
jgi:hypothetical protein